MRKGSKFILLFFVCLCFSYNSFAQCQQIAIPLSTSLEQSSYILKGEVIQKESYWRDSNNQIYTHNFIKIKQAIKGKLENIIVVITQGGQVGDIGGIVTPSLQLNIGDEGTFLLQENNQTEHQHPAFSTFFPTNIQHGFTAIEEQLKEENKAKVIQPILTITDIQPLQVNAGVEDIMTVSGIGFGNYNPPAKIQFRNPDYFPPTVVYQSVPDDHILSWTDTQIQVKVPSKDLISGKAGAGSGTIRVVSEAGELLISSQEVRIGYNKMNINQREIDLVDTNNEGGYTFFLDNDFPIVAKEAFIRALETWNCETQSPFLLSEQTVANACPANDGRNTITFDNNCQLPEGTLAQTTHWYAACGNGDAFFQEIDIVFANPSKINWNYNQQIASGSQKDFESICLHELGHVHGLGHVLNNATTMFPSLADGENVRYIDEDALVGANEILAHSQISNNCGGSTAIHLQSSNCIPTQALSIRAKVYLEGAMQDTQQETLLQSLDLLPAQNPFETEPWNHVGLENLSPIPTNMVDWLLLEIQDENFNVLERQAAWLRDDGMVMSTDGQEKISFTMLNSNKAYHLVIRHRNHLAIISSQALSLDNTPLFDFTQPQNVRGNNSLKELDNDIFAMHAGDFNADGVITLTDFNLYQTQSASIGQYLLSDGDFNGIVSVADFNIYQSNISLIGDAAIRY